MKKISYKIFSSFLAAATLLSAACFNVNASSIQTRGSWHMYGDVNEDGLINVSDVVLINKARAKYEELTGDPNLPVGYAVARPSIYFENIENPVPQAADVNGDGYINLDDSTLIQRFIIHLEDTGRCGEPFFIN